MQNKYVIDNSSIEQLKQKFLLVDTNFIIDASIFPDEASELILQLDKLNCELITTRSVIIEFLGGTKDETLLKDKAELLSIVFARPIQQIANLQVFKYLPIIDEFLVYSRQCNKFDITDFELYIALKKYRQSNILLLTRNHLDFTAKLFNRVGFITLLGNKEIKTYGLYKAK